MLNGAVKDFNFAARVKGPARTVSTQFLPDAGPQRDLLGLPRAARLKRCSRPAGPLIRWSGSLLVTGILESCLKSRASGGKRIETPHLNVRYQAPKESQHARA